MTTAERIRPLIADAVRRRVEASRRAGHSHFTALLILARAGVSFERAVYALRKYPGAKP